MKQYLKFDIVDKITLFIIIIFLGTVTSLAYYNQLSNEKLFQSIILLAVMVLLIQTLAIRDYLESIKNKND